MPGGGAYIAGGGPEGGAYPPGTGISGFPPGRGGGPGKDPGEDMYEGFCKHGQNSTNFPKQTSLHILDGSLSFVEMILHIVAEDLVVELLDMSAKE